MPGLITWCGRIRLRHTNTRRIYWRKWRLEMFSVESEFSFVRSLYSALYHEYYIGNSEWVYRERFRTQLKCVCVCVCVCVFVWCLPLCLNKGWLYIPPGLAHDKARLEDAFLMTVFTQTVFYPTLSPQFYTPGETPNYSCCSLIFKWTDIFLSSGSIRPQQFKPREYDWNCYPRLCVRYFVFFAGYLNNT